MEETKQRKGSKGCRVVKMKTEEIRKILATGTNMTERDIERHIKDGVSVYDNTEAGYKASKK